MTPRLSAVADPSHPPELSVGLARSTPAPTACPHTHVPAEAPCPPAPTPAPGGLSPTAAADDPRLISMLPAQLLHDGEIIILLLKPSPWFVLLEALPAIGWILLGAVGLAGLSKYGLTLLGSRDLTLLTATALGVRLVWQFLDWISRVYVLTDRRVLRVRGVLRISVFECPLARIQNTQTTFRLRERLLGLGTIMFVTAGQSPLSEGGSASWVMLSRPLEIHQLVIKTLDRYR